jgi:hypothetical protein
MNLWILLCNGKISDCVETVLGPFCKIDSSGARVTQVWISFEDDMLADELT